MDAQPHLGNHAPGRSFRNDVPQMNTALESLVQRAPVRFHRPLALRGYRRAGVEGTAVER
jgi:hypothetical protein